MHLHALPGAWPFPPEPASPGTESCTQAGCQGKGVQSSSPGVSRRQTLLRFGVFGTVKFELGDSVFPNHCIALMR